MNDALISGLLGAIMGGTSSIEKSIAEEEAARRKEEEEKRREERALTLAERKADAEQKRKQILEEQERAKIAKTAPDKAPETGIVGNAIDEYQGEIANTGYTGQTRQATPEEALRWSIGKAREEGREDLAKQREDALYKMLEESRRAAKESREQIDFARGKPEKTTEATRSFEANVIAAYTGPKDAEGKPLDPEDFNRFRARAASAKLFGRERPEGVEKPLTRADTLKLEGALRGSLKDRSRVQEKAGEAPVFKEGVYSDLVTIANKIKKADPDLIRAPDVVADEAYRQYQDFAESARSSAKSEWTRLNTPIKDDKEAEKKRRKDLESLKTSERISSERTYIEKKSPQILRGLIGVGQQKEKEEFDPNDPLGFFKK